jgi:predicted GNAT family acetyltransferase
VDTQPDSWQVQNNIAASRFEVEVDGLLAVIVYVHSGETITFTHTQVPPALEGHGLAGSMAHAALEYAKMQDLVVVPLCPFVASYIRRHQEYLPLVHPEHHTRVTAHTREPSR